LTGLQTIAELRAKLRREVPALILTGDISTETLQKIAHERCAHLNKPANAEELTRLVGRMLGVRNRLEADGRKRSANVLENKVPSPMPEGNLSSPTVFVIEDEAAQRTTMLELLSLNGLAAEAYSSCEGFLEAYRPSRTGCLVIDVMMHGMGGIALLERLKKEKSDLPAIMVTGFGDVSMAVRAMKAGAVDFIEKPIDPDELIASIERAMDRAQGSAARSDRKAVAATSLANLTPRERLVMDLVLAGHPSKNIASDLGISQRTVENHRASIMRKTGSKSIPALIRLALAAV
jgi:two-component system CheB/CheR fusion protein